jgi:hypothetical protein
VTTVARRRPPARAPLPAQRPRPSSGAVADAIGCCVLAFAFLPPLASLVSWLWFEAGNPLNLQNRFVLEFVPVRGAVELVSSFLAGVVPGVVGGAIDGALVVAWWTSRGVPTRRHALALGAVTGALAATAMMLAVLGYQAATTSVPLPPIATLAAELGYGVVCGILSAPRAVRLLAGDAAVEPPAALAPARRR